MTPILKICNWRCRQPTPGLCFSIPLLFTACCKIIAIAEINDISGEGIAQEDLAPADVIEDLTARESEVLRLVSMGLGNKEIAIRLAISEHTAKFHISSILSKLHAGSRTEAVSLGIRKGLIPI